MCQWCIENSKCPCQIECEVELTASHAAGNIVSQCPRCRHTIQRIRQCLRINEFHPPNEDNWFCGDQIKIDIETNTTIKKIQEVENMIGIYDTVVIYCQPFGVYFGQAKLI